MATVDYAYVVSTVRPKTISIVLMARQSSDRRSLFTPPAGVLQGELPATLVSASADTVCRGGRRIAAARPTTVHGRAGHRASPGCGRPRASRQPVRRCCQQGSVSAEAGRTRSRGKGSDGFQRNCD
ncbi:Protein of unknown function [Micromonospora lupini str. Lupac 08]|uniref:Uncharacterized protein n=1 Tax=Micromonospora lupini str. Lupac 08 TaxID=1150864 RepID=I0KXQ7_9ACTN|nr:Protein of unknown function [Micromonospora lupini str. Lupac 08]